MTSESTAAGGDEADDVSGEALWVVACYDYGVDGRDRPTVFKVVGPFVTQQDAIDASQHHSLRPLRLTPPAEACVQCVFGGDHPIHDDGSIWYGAHPFTSAAARQEGR